MILILSILMGFVAGWRFGGRRMVMFMPALAFAIIQVGHLILSAITNTLGDSTLLPILMCVLWLSATWIGATITAKRVTG